MPTHRLTCPCGHTFTSEKDKDYCSKCGGAVFLDPQKQRGYKMNTYYIYGVILCVVTFLTYIFIEMIAKPILSF